MWRIQHIMHVLKDKKGIGVVEVILILVDIYIMGERYIYCEWR